MKFNKLFWYITSLILIIFLVFSFSLITYSKVIEKIDNRKETNNSSKIVSYDSINEYAKTSFDNNESYERQDNLVKTDFQITSVLSKTMQYDDTFDICDDFPEYYVTNVMNENITSYQVINGKTSSKKDSSIVQFLNTEHTIFRATAVGTITLTLAKSSQKNLEKLFWTDLIYLELKINPAPLTMVYVLGQSNAFGYVNWKQNPFNPSNSIKCESNKVYCAIGPNSKEIGKYTTSYDFPYGISDKNYNEFVPGNISTIATNSVSGQQLYCPISILTNEVGGKTGLDASFAYKWNELTNDKVFIVNASISGEPINVWEKGNQQSIAQKLFYKAAQEVYDCEIDAGHFLKKQKLVVWLQGESDFSTEYTKYKSSFDSMYEDIQNFFSFDYFGIILPRAEYNVSDYTRKALTLTSPRRYQSYLGNSKTHSNIFVISNDHELWLSNEEIKAYGDSHYKNGILDYPMHNGSDISTFNVDKITLHYYLHFSQIGHNENGLLAAQGMYNAINNILNNDEVRWITEKGDFLIDNTYVNQIDNSFILMPHFYPAPSGKETTLKYDKSKLSYDVDTQTFTIMEKGKSTVNVLNKYGKVIDTITVDTSNNYPQIDYISQHGDSVNISWNKIPGVMKYKVFYNTGTSWKCIETTSDTNITYNAPFGYKYRYTVRGCDNAGEYITNYDHVGYEFTSYQSGIELIHSGNDNQTISFKWTKNNNASKYQIQYKRHNWDYFKDLAITTSTSYTDKNCKNNIVYDYRVYAIDNKGNRITDLSNVISIKYFDAPKITSVKAINEQGKVKISWNYVDGCSNYRIYYKRLDKSTSWKALANLTSNTYTDYGCVNGKKYAYVVKCLDENISASSTSSNRMEILYYKFPENIKATQIDNNGHINITWDKVSGVSKYRIYYKRVGPLYSTDWKIIKTQDSNSFTDSNCKKDVLYTYTIRCVNDNNELISAYDPNGAQIKYQ